MTAHVSLGDRQRHMLQLSNLCAGFRHLLPHVPRVAARYLSHLDMPKAELSVGKLSECRLRGTAAEIRNAYEPWPLGLRRDTARAP